MEASRHYSTLSPEEVAGLPVAALACESAHLWLWTVNALVGEAHDVARSWGFAPVTMLTWCKPGPGVGHYLRNNTEHAVFATRGKAVTPAEPAMGSWFVWPRTRHSVKPAGFLDLVERVSPGPYVELFARQPRLGWDHWGYGFEAAG